MDSRTCRACQSPVGKGKYYCPGCFRSRRSQADRQRKKRNRQVGLYRTAACVTCSASIKPNKTGQCWACTTKRTVATCPHCGCEFWPWANGASHARLFCSRTCAPAGRRTPEFVRAERVAREAALKKVCAWCEQPFVATTTMQRFCCRSHQNIAKSKRRKALLRDVGGEAPSIGAIYQRDRGICQLCWTRVSRAYTWPDGRVPSRDHIVPLSLGGRDEAANIQLAHLGCNIAKRERACGSQLRLIG
jgi:hypothetical protein